MGGEEIGIGRSPMLQSLVQSFKAYSNVQRMAVTPLG